MNYWFIWTIIRWGIRGNNYARLGVLISQEPCKFNLRNLKIDLRSCSLIFLIRFLYCCHAPLNSVCQLKLWKWKLIYKLQAYETAHCNVRITLHSSRKFWCKRTLKLLLRSGRSPAAVFLTPYGKLSSNVVFISELHIVCAPSHMMLCRTL